MVKGKFSNHKRTKKESLYINAAAAEALSQLDLIDRSKCPSQLTKKQIKLPVKYTSVIENLIYNCKYMNSKIKKEFNLLPTMVDGWFDQQQFYGHQINAC